MTNSQYELGIQSLYFNQGRNLANSSSKHILDIYGSMLEVFEFALSTNERARKVTTDQSEAWKQQNRTPLLATIQVLHQKFEKFIKTNQNVPKTVDNH